ncbi:aminoacyl-tRNA hydrolase [Ruminococcus champanellensis]|uniref:Peptidyl-tRNA hydrolase n=1 Tax=Ruminococcus champanellensis (strain DSM 18848 / JCM 17042 / KCTC 15320 / 18P13) TaxID=213810 RepID=D4LFA3_RUMC1|nr:aminoacyl-tRNA hydrolase [Ruminococcus champanellensis]CBL18298.1 peptidyl-tRNA hydrolase [Ruminococcus champanellensis 18P13 = JCM 17042]
MSIFDLFKQVESAAPAGPPEYLIVGLGNPGLEYAQTRHNAGFMTLDLLAEREHTEIKRMKFKSLCGDAVIAGKRCLLMKPTTYMNNSGQAVAEAMQFYKLPIDHIIVVYDDISLEPSRLRIRRKGSDGGHNGIKSIIYLTGEDTFPRIKLGVGKKPRPDYNLADWVLSRFTKEELEQMHIAAEHACESIALMVNGKIDEAMNRYNA